LSAGRVDARIVEVDCKVGPRRIKKAALQIEGAISVVAFVVEKQILARVEPSSLHSRRARVRILRQQDG